MINCPVCHINGRMDIPPEVIENKQAGLVTINVPRDYVCPHAFQVFIDRNNVIRGYQKSDFQVELKREIKEVVHDALEDLKVFEISAQGIMHIATAEIFLAITKSLLLEIPITIISRNELFNKGIIAFFGDILPNIKSALFLPQLNYDQDYKWDGLVVDINYKMVNQDPSQSQFLIGEDLSNSLWNAPDVVTQKILLNNFIDKLKQDFLLFENVVKQEKYAIKLKDLIKMIERTYNIPTKKQRIRFLYEMLRHRKPEIAEKVDDHDPFMDSMISLWG